MYQIVFCSCPNNEVATQIATRLVTSKLAACVNIVPNITSVYLWQDKVETDSEVLLKIKSKASLFETIEKEITSLHPYDVPEIIATDITQGSQAYLNWLNASVETK